MRVFEKVIFLICAPLLLVVLIPVALLIKISEGWEEYSAWYDNQFPEKTSKVKADKTW